MNCKLTTPPSQKKTVHWWTFQKCILVRPFSLAWPQGHFSMNEHFVCQDDSETMSARELDEAVRPDSFGEAEGRRFHHVSTEKGSQVDEQRNGMPRESEMEDLSGKVEFNLCL